MQSTTLALLVVAALLAAAIGVRAEPADAHANDGVDELSVEAFRKEVAKDRPLLVNFYTNWCKHCQLTAPIFAELASIVKARTDLNVKVAKMNVEEDHKKELAAELRVHAYPTIRMYQDGKHTEYQKERLVPDMLRWIERKLGKGIPELATKEQVNEFIASANVAVVGFFEKQSSPAVKAFREASKDLDEFLFGMVTKKELLQAFDAEDGTMAVFKKYDEGRMDIPLIPTKSAVRRAVVGAARPLVSEFGAVDTVSLFDPRANANRTLLAVFLSRKAGHFEQYESMLRAVAIEHKNCTFMTVNADAEENQAIYNVFEVKNTSVPAMRMLDFSAVKRFKPLMDTMHPEAIRAFLHGVNSGAIKSTEGNPDAPENWDAGTVKLLVPSTFEAVVYDGRRHAVVVFGKELCPKCVAMDPIFEEVAEMYVGQAALVFAKVSVRNSDIDGKAGMSIKGIPTIAVYPKSKKDSPAVFAGEHTLEDLLSFVKKHTGLKPTASRKEKSSMDSSAGRGEL